MSLREDFKTNPMRQLNVFLGLIGLSLKKDKKRMFKGKVSYFYKLDPKNLKFMTGIRPSLRRPSKAAAEPGTSDEMKVPVNTMAALGCETLLQTNAAGSLRLDMPPGALMAITDHINFTGVNPLFGAGPERRFVDMIDAYDPKLTGQLLAAARKSGIACQAGVYIWFCGPSFETPAEIRAAKALGADAVGMSTAPETILARHAGLKVVGLSVMTNYAAGMVPGGIGHDQTITVANQASGDVRRLLRGFLESYV